jgi:hypothetical protein
MFPSWLWGRALFRCKAAVAGISSRATQVTANDISRLDAFLERLRTGYDLMIGNRFAGAIKPGAGSRKTPYTGNVLRIVTFERGVLAGRSAALAGTLFGTQSVLEWSEHASGIMDFATVAHVLIPSAMAAALCSEVVLFSSLFGALQLSVRGVYPQRAAHSQQLEMARISAGWRGGRISIRTDPGR